MQTKEFNIQNVRDEIFEILSANPGLVKSVGIFGSLARGDYNSDSDIDLLIEYNSPPVFAMESFTDFCRLCNQIEERLANTYNCGVDIVHIENGNLDNLYDKNVASEVRWI